MFLVFRESQGSFQYGNYRREAEDLRSVLQHLRGENRGISAIIGHSKGLKTSNKGGFGFQEKGNIKTETLLLLLSGGNVVLLYAAKYKDVETVVNISGRFFLERGIEGRLGKDYFRRIKENGFIDVRNRKGT